MPERTSRVAVHAECTPAHRVQSSAPASPPPQANPSSRILSRLSDDQRRIDEHLNNGEGGGAGVCSLVTLSRALCVACACQRLHLCRHGVHGNRPALAPTVCRPRPPSARAAFLGCATLLCMAVVSLVMVIISLP